MSKINPIIKKSLLIKQKEISHFSLRSLAKRLGVQHSFLSALLSNKKKWPLTLLDKVIQILEIDAMNRKKMAEIIIEEQLKDLRKNSKLLRETWFSKTSEPKIQETSDPLSLFKEESNNSNPLLAHWYMIALLDLATCDDFRVDYNWIAKRLSITAYEAEFAWKTLVTKKYLIEVDGLWKKNENHLRFPTVKSESSIRKYHRELIQKGLQYLTDEQLMATPFDLRLIGGLSVATNMENLQKAKVHFQESSYQTAQIMSDGKCNEVYQIYYLLFPVTKLQKK